MIASLEKVVPTVEDAFTLLRLLARSATGQEFSTYTTVHDRPEAAGRPATGPSASTSCCSTTAARQMLGNEFREMLRCIRCGACMNHCPVYLATGGHAYGWVYPGPMGSVLTPQFIGIEQGWPLPNASTFCGRCEEVCPVRIPLPKLMRHLARGAVPPRPRPADRPLRAGGLGASSPASPRLYRLATALAASGLRAARPRAAACAGRRSPAAGRATRDLPAPQGATFMSQWRAPGKAPR